MNTAEHIPDWILAFARLEHCITDALQYSDNTHAAEDIIAGIIKGEFQFWWNKDSAIVTEIVQFPRKKFCNYFLAGGNMGDLQELVPEIEAWAQKNGCDEICLVGRRGWSRSFLTDAGYKTRWAVLAKELSDELQQK